MKYGGDVGAGKRRKGSTHRVHLLERHGRHRRCNPDGLETHHMMEGRKKRLVAVKTRSRRIIA